jgi:uncharacterized membrane protein YoaK (UPF0700 family)
MVSTAGSRSEVWFVFGLAFVGGYSDAISYIFVRTFTGHITGNAVLSAIGIATHNWLLATNNLIAIVAFLLGVILSLIVSRFAHRQRHSSPEAFSLCMEAALILIAVGLGKDLRQLPNQLLFTVFMCLALGLQNGTWQEVSGQTIHTNYITGTASKLVEYIAERLKCDRSHHRIAKTSPGRFNLRFFPAILIGFLLGALSGANLALYFRSVAATGVAVLVLLLAFYKWRSPTQNQ